MLSNTNPDLSDSKETQPHPNSSSLVRHCASCLLQIQAKQIKLCGACKKRAYCSKECQTSDWQVKEGSQGHKAWCELNAGEEDITWSVQPIQSKGLGVVALKPIKKGERVMVDACRGMDHAGIKDLVPLGGSLNEKVEMNALGCYQHASVVCLRLSRVNHACDSNTNHVYDNTFFVKVLVAERDIQVGEEITINYSSFNRVQASFIRTGEEARGTLMQRWGIECPLDCFCRDENIAMLVNKGRALDKAMLEHGNAFKPDNALEVMQELLPLLKTIHASLPGMVLTFFDGFQVGISQKKTVKRGVEFLKMAYKITSQIYHPDSETNLKYRKLIADPSTEAYYLVCDKYAM